MLELDQDEGGSGDVADHAGAEGHPLQGPPPLGHQREAAFALVAQRAEQRVAGFRVRVQLAAGRFLHRDVHACVGAFITGIGQERQVLKVRPCLRQHVLAGGGQVVGVLPGSTSETHGGTPRGADSAWTFPPG